MEVGLGRARYSNSVTTLSMPYPSAELMSEVGGPGGSDGGVGVGKIFTAILTP